MSKRTPDNLNKLKKKYPKMFKFETDNEFLYRDELPKSYFSIPIISSRVNQDLVKEDNND